jgi:hypothetical protein
MGWALDCNPMHEDFSSSPTFFFLPLKNLILSLIKILVCRNRNFSSSNFRKNSVSRNKNCISRKKNRFIELEIEFFIEWPNRKFKGWKRNLGARREIFPMYLSSSFFSQDYYFCHLMVYGARHTKWAKWPCPWNGILVISQSAHE